MLSSPFTNRSSRMGGDENPYWISFSDIMAGLLVIFILASIHLILELAEQKEAIKLDIELIKRVHEIRAQMLLEIKEELAKERINVEISDNESVLHIPDELAFAENKATIPKDKEIFVGKVGEAIFSALMREKRMEFVDTIFIEGHTDSKPAPRYPNGNWGLSTDRAISIWKYWIEKLEVGQEIQAIENKEGHKIFSVSGYAATRRIVEPDTTDSQRRRNRRIDIRFTMFSPSVRDFESILGNIQ